MFMVALDYDDGMDQFEEISCHCLCNGNYFVAQECQPTFYTNSVKAGAGFCALPVVPSFIFWESLVPDLIYVTGTDFTMGMICLIFVLPTCAKSSWVPTSLSALHFAGLRVRLGSYNPSPDPTLCGSFYALGLSFVLSTFKT
jgi:hypothetical protein